MFLGVSVSVVDVNMNDLQRERFAGLLRQLQRTQYGNNKKAAYTAARLNSATWERLIEGLSVKPSTVTQVVDFFWPEAAGDWTLVLDSTVGGVEQDADKEFVRAPGPRADGRASDSEVLDAIRELQRELREVEERLGDKIVTGDLALSERLDRLEGEGS